MKSYAHAYTRFNNSYYTKKQEGNIMTINEAVAHRIKQLCEEKEIPIKKLAKQSGITEKTIKDILKAPHNRRVRMITILKLCNAFGVSAYQFLNTPEFDALEQEVE